MFAHEWARAVVHRRGLLLGGVGLGPRPARSAAPSSPARPPACAAPPATSPTTSAAPSTPAESPDTGDLYRMAPVLEEKLRGLPGLQDVTSDLQVTSPQVNVEIDREDANAGFNNPAGRGADGNDFQFRMRGSPAGSWSPSSGWGCSSPPSASPSGSMVKCFA